MKTHTWLVRGKARNLRGEVFTHVARIIADTPGEAMNAAIGDVPGQERISWWVGEPTAEDEGETTWGEAPHVPIAPMAQRVVVVKLDRADTRDERDAIMQLAAALAFAGYSQADVDALSQALTNNEVQAVLLKLDQPLEDGTAEMWFIEQPGAVPPQNWTLPLWRSRLHTPTCGRCGHHSEDALPACECACHDLFAGILNF